MSLIIQRDQEQELIIEKITELLNKEDWEVKSIFPYFHKNRTTVQVIIRKNYNTNSFPSFNEDDFKRMMTEIKEEQEADQERRDWLKSPEGLKCREEFDKLGEAEPVRLIQCNVCGQASGFVMCADCNLKCLAKALKSQEQIDTTAFLESFQKIKENLEFELKNGSWNEDIKNNTKDKDFWNGYRYGIMSIITDYLVSEIEKWEAKLK